MLSLPRIHGYRAFRDYRWPNDLHQFAQVNVVYGWNGSGKTTPSSLLEHVEKRQPVSEGGVRFEFDSLGRVEGDALASTPVPPARVFHRPFVERTIRAIDTGVGHIYFEVPMIEAANRMPCPLELLVGGCLRLVRVEAPADQDEWALAIQPRPADGWPWRQRGRMALAATRARA